MSGLSGSKLEFDVVVLGGGPAGTHAALEATRAGLRVALFDDNGAAGGRVYRAPSAVNRAENGVDHRFGDSLRGDLAASSVTTFFAHTVWAVTGNYRIDASGPRGSMHCTARALIVATGATERVVPFEGWTTPGVIGLAAATALLKSHGTLPGSSTLLAGCGPLLAAVAAKTIEGGGKVAAVADLAGTVDWLKALPALAARPGMLAQGLAWRRTIRRSGTRWLDRHVVVRVERVGERLRATLAKCDAGGRVIGGGQTTVFADCVVVGHGLVPSSDATQLLRAEQCYSRTAGGWIVVADRDGRTSRSQLYVAGDAAGLAGADAAAIHGKLAGLVCASELKNPHAPGNLDAYALRRRIDVLRGQHRRAARAGRAMANLMALRPAHVGGIPPEVIACRCEDVTRADIDAACDAGARDMNQLKAWTRCGMGPCQGRSCGDVAGELLRLRVGATSRETVGHFTARVPLRPVIVEALTGDFRYEDIGIPESAPL